MDSFRLIADSYLDHIRIAVEAKDQSAPFRDFMDNWNAYRLEADHHRNQSGGVRWFNNPSANARIKMLEALDFRSSGAERILAMARSDPRAYQAKYVQRDRAARLIIDHAVPVAIMSNQLMAGAIPLDRENIENYLIRWYRLGLLSSEEDSLLNKNGLRSNMPNEWDGRDVFARYKMVGIVSYKA